MIYHFRIRVRDGKDTIEKDLYLTEDNQKAFYRRAASQYRLDIRDIEIIEEIPDEDIDISTDIFKKPKNKVSKAEEVVNEEPDTTYLDKAKEMLCSEVRGLNQDKIDQRISSGWKYHCLIVPDADLSEALKNFNTVKLYYRKGGPRKNKEYFILYK